jgi:hypothetical protein
MPEPPDTPTRRFSRRGDLVTRRIAGETLIVPVSSGVGDMESIFTLNDVGSLLWERIEARATVAEMVEAVCEEFDVSHAEAEKDVLEFLRSLEEAGLIHPYESEAAGERG